ncbi:PepSY-associated TM helix domain-containing protein [Nitrospira lenta]|uniref:Peptidase n=1 Tax=Nitrospira lenta TaxID=1436998 RepID=A0A330L8J5_9BACT|nr:PepSY domain-containing protein [Nitrospira lenta]SPP65579.1 Peptidase [Nitrospira lenta]
MTIAPHMPAGVTLKRWYAVHKWTSLVCTLFLLLLCVTGLPLIFGEEIGLWSGASVEPPALAGDLPRVDLDRLVADARMRRPQDAVLFLSQDDDAPVWFLSMGHTPDADEDSAVYVYDGRTGALLLEPPLRQGFMHVMFALHVELFAGLPGTLFLGGMGCLFVLSVLSGVVVYGPFMRKLPFGTVRHEGSRRLTWLDLHNLLGIATVVWALVVGGTGVINTLARPLFAYWQQTELAEMTAPWQGKPRMTAFSSLNRAVAAAESTDAGKEIAFVAFPGTPFAGPHHYAIFMRGKTPLTARLIEPVLIDAETGEVAAVRAMPWYITALSVSQPLHFGDYGGLPLKSVWAVLDVITIVVLCSGLYLWWKKRNMSADQFAVTTEGQISSSGVPSIVAGVR